MAIVWCGGEPVDFPNGSIVVVNITAGNFRSGYGRGCLYSLNIAKSNIFSGGALTSCWFSARIYSAASTSDVKIVGLGKLGTDSGIWIGNTGTSKLGLFKFDGTTLIELDVESGTTFTAVLHKIDVQITNWGDSANIKVYNDSILIINYTGDPRPPGIDDLDIVVLMGTTAILVSEIIIADEDTRTMSLVTLAPNLAGDLNQWTGAYTAIDEYTIDDADVIYSTVADQDFQCNLTATPTGTFVVRAIKISARAVRGATGISQIKLGIKSGVSVNVDDAITLSTIWETKERLMLVNPVTTNLFTTAELDALQINLRSIAAVSASISPSVSPSISPSVSESVSSSVSESVSESSSPSA